MEFSPNLCRAGRALLEWSAADLAAAAKVGIATVKRFEAGDAVRQPTKDALRGAMESAGLMFLAVGEKAPVGGEGVRRAT